MEVSKVAAPESTKFQVSFYSADQTLINLYASSKEELESLLNTAQDFSPLIGSVVQSYKGSSSPAPVSSAAPAVASAPSAGGEETVNDKYGNIWVYNHPSAPECSRGKMVLKHGKAQATGKPYKGWFDPATGPKWTGAKVPKDQQAATIWA
jgi:hypothetical protein